MMKRLLNVIPGLASGNEPTVPTAGFVDATQAASTNLQGAWATNAASKGEFHFDRVVADASDLPLRFLALTHSQNGAIKLPRDAMGEVAIIVFPPEPEQQAVSKVVRLTVPGWLERNTDNVSLSMSLNRQVAALGYSAPQAVEARREIVAAVNGVNPERLPAEMGQAAGADAQRAVANAKEVESNPFYKLVFDLLREAVIYNAADIHIETRYGVDPASQKNSSRIRLRIDGELEDVDLGRPEMRDPATLRSIVGYIFNDLCDDKSDQQFNPANFLSAQLTDRKVGNTLIRGRFQTFDISGTQAPNGDKPFDLVMRILYADRVDIKSLSELGFLPSQVRILQRYIDGRSKMACVSGKVGSGKSTTLRSLFAMLPLEWKKYAAEDPVEYYHPNTSQINLSDKEAIQRVLNSLKRGDLDALLMGEVRNKHSMSLVRNVTFSGHPAFTTTHSESALGQLPYFLSPEMGMDAFELANPAFIGVLFHQVLVRKLCPHCAISDREKVHAALGKERLAKLEDVYRVPLDGLRIRNEAGCPHCQDKLRSRYGYAGMDVLAELFEPDLEDLQLIERKQLVDLNVRWRKSHTPFDVEDCTGKNTLEIGIYKAINGVVDLRSVEKIRPILDARVYEADRR